MVISFKICSALIAWLLFAIFILHLVTGPPVYFIPSGIFINRVYAGPFKSNGMLSVRHISWNRPGSPVSLLMTVTVEVAVSPNRILIVVPFWCCRSIRCVWGTIENLRPRIFIFSSMVCALATNPYGRKRMNNKLFFHIVLIYMFFLIKQTYKNQWVDPWNRYIKRKKALQVDVL